MTPTTRRRRSFPSPQTARPGRRAAARRAGRTARPRCGLRSLPYVPPRAVAHRAGAGGRGRRPVARPTDRRRARVRRSAASETSRRDRARAPVGGRRADPPRARSGAVHPNDATHHPRAAEPRRAPGVLRARLGRSWPRPLLRRIHEPRAAIPSSRSRSRRALETDRCVRELRFPSPATSRSCSGHGSTSLPADARVGPPGRRRRRPSRRRSSSRRRPDWISTRSDALAAAERAGVIETALGTASGSRTRCWRRRCTRAPRPTNAEPPIERSPTTRPTRRSEPGISPCLRRDPTHRSPRRSTTRRAWRGLGVRRSPAAELADLAVEAHPARPIAEGARSPRRRGGGPSLRRRERDPRAASCSSRRPPRRLRDRRGREILWRLADASWMEVDLVRSYLDEGLRRCVAAIPRGERDPDGSRMDVDLWRRCRAGRDRGPAVPGDRRATRRPSPDLGGARGARDLRVPRRPGWRGSHRPRGVASGDAARSPTRTRLPASTMGLRSLWAGELDAARSTLEAVLDHLAERGLYTLATEPHEYLGEIECRAGRYELAAQHAATRHRDQARSGVRGAECARPVSPGTRRRAPWGRGVGPRARASRADMVRTRGPPLRELQPCGARVPRAVAGAVRRGQRAPRSCGPVPARDGRPGAVRHPGPRRRDRGADRYGGPRWPQPTLLAEFEDWAGQAARPWALATAARCRALLRASRRRSQRGR